MFLSQYKWLLFSVVTTNLLMKWLEFYRLELCKYFHLSCVCFISKIVFSGILCLFPSDRSLVSITFKKCGLHEMFFAAVFSFCNQRGSYAVWVVLWFITPQFSVLYLFKTAKMNSIFSNQKVSGVYGL